MLAHTVQPAHLSAVYLCVHNRLCNIEQPLYQLSVAENTCY